MERQNITLSIPKETLKKARHIAVEKETSLSGLLAGYIEELVYHDDLYRNAQKQQQLIMERGIDFGLNETVGWSREDLHERD